MKKYFLLFVCFLTLFFSNTVLANENTLSSEQKVAMLRSQHDTIKSKVNSISYVYKATVDNLVINLLDEIQISKLKKDSTELNLNSYSITEANIMIVELETLTINKQLNKPFSKTLFKNLTTGQKYAVKKDLNQLLNIKSAYLQISEQSKKLSKDIQSDNFSNLSLKKELNNLNKFQQTSTKQIKNINKLIYNICNNASNVGIVLQ